jgi:hypothetical protein
MNSFNIQRAIQYIQRMNEHAQGLRWNRGGGFSGCEGISRERGDSLSGYEGSCGGQLGARRTGSACRLAGEAAGKLRPSADPGAGPRSAARAVRRQAAGCASGRLQVRVRTWPVASHASLASSTASGPHATKPKSRLRRAAHCGPAGTGLGSGRVKALPSASARREVRTRTLLPPHTQCSQPVRPASSRRTRLSQPSARPAR